MKNQYAILFVLMSFLSLLGGCGGRQTVIVVPDREGQVGQVEVTTAGGRQVLNKSGDMTSVSGRNAAPAAVKTASADYIATTFAEALAVEPPPARKFALYFETDTTVLTADSLKQVSDIVAEARRPGTLTIAVSGHTDAVGTTEYNDKLARDRAAFVRQLLVDRGVKADLISVSSHGKGNPAVPTPDGVAEPRNRRVEIVIH